MTPGGTSTTRSSFFHATAILVPLATLVYLAYRRIVTSEKEETKSKSDITQYGLFHLSLNKLPNELPGEPPKTEWLNMGYWKGTSSFPEACRALAMKVIKAAKVKPGHSVLDVGFGTGECLVLLLSDPAVPRPSKVSGITDMASHCDRTKARLQKIQEADHDEPAVQVNLLAGDAIYRPNTHKSWEKKHPLDPTSKEKYDAILATDCAYHFNSRRAFLSQAFKMLRPGGRIALADICFANSALSTWRARVITYILRLMPLQNRISESDYLRQMVLGCGYENVVAEDITEQVFPHFIRFLKRQGILWWLFATVLQLYTSSGARFVVISGEKPL